MGKRKSGLRAYPSIRDLKEALAYMPRAVSVDVAAAVAPAITTMAQASFDSGVDVYGAPRPLSTQGKPLDLYETGAVRRDMKFTALDTKVTCTIGPNYARFLIGKYKILPIGDRSPVPATWARAIEQATQAAVDKQVRALPRSA